MEEIPLQMGFKIALVKGPRFNNCKIQDRSSMEVPNSAGNVLEMSP